MPKNVVETNSQRDSHKEFTPNVLERVALSWSTKTRRRLSIPLRVVAFCTYGLAGLVATVPFAFAMSSAAGFGGGLSFAEIAIGAPLCLLVFAVFFFVGAASDRVSRYLRSETAEELLQHDRRTPILFLRSFSVDGVGIPVKDTVNSLPRDIGGPFFYQKTSDTLEEVLVRQFAKVGPVVAISRPDQGLPPPGAGRFMILGAANETWRERVKQLIDECCGVVLVAGKSAGLLWELKQVVEQNALDKTHVIFPPKSPDPRIHPGDPIAEFIEHLSMLGVRLEHTEPPSPIEGRQVLGMRFQGEVPTFVIDEMTHQGYSRAFPGDSEVSDVQHASNEGQSENEASPRIGGRRNSYLEAEDPRPEHAETSAAVGDTIDHTAYWEAAATQWRYLKRASPYRESEESADSIVITTATGPMRSCALGLFSIAAFLLIVAAFAFLQENTYMALSFGGFALIPLGIGLLTVRSRVARHEFAILALDNSVLHVLASDEKVEWHRIVNAREHSLHGFPAAKFIVLTICDDSGRTSEMAVAMNQVWIANVTRVVVLIGRFSASARATRLSCEDR